MKLKDISRTATFAWDQSSSSSPLLATGAVAGALDENFSNESQLEIWAPDFGDAAGIRLGGEGKPAQGSITVNNRFNRLAWSAPSTTHSKGLIAAGLESGEVNLFDPEKILSGSSADDSRIFRSEKHTGPVRGLDFNPIQKNLLLTGAVDAELFIYDLNNPNNAPVPPGPKSSKLNEITSLQWNPTVARVFAASSSSGYTSVWDLKAGKEVVSLQYGGGAAKGMDAVGGQAGLQMGKRRGMSDVCWHPDQATRLITASEDDESPIIMLWDLRNTRAPEKDADLLLSCGKDNRTLCWNPQTGEIIGELPASNDWSFQTTWCPRNPDLLATASFDGHIGIHSLQTTSMPEPTNEKLSETVSAEDVFGALGQADQVDDTANVLSLKQPPKWLRRPVSATFGFGGLLATTSNLPGASGKHQSGVVHLRNVVTEQSVVDRATALDATSGEKDKLADFCTDRASGDDAAWKALHALFKADSRDEIVQLLGFSKEEVARKVQEAISRLPAHKGSDEQPAEPAAVAEPDSKDESGVATPTAEKSIDEVVPTEEPKTADSETTSSAGKSLFDDDDNGPGTPAAGDFFSSMAAGTLRNPQLDSIVPHKNNELTDSSVAATVGSRASSIRDEVITKENTFQIYPDGESDVDKLITQALVVGDFKSAVDLCLASERFADALLLAVRGGPELLQSTQKAYFTRRTTSLPFLRVFQSIVTEDLVDIVQNADLSEWKVAFVVVCTFAKEGEFGNLAEQLGQRLQHRWRTLSSSDSPEAKESAKVARQDATLCYLAARKLEKVISIWVDEMTEEEDATDSTRYTSHAQALQSFIEKVAVFTAATAYVDEDLLTPTESAVAAEAGARTYKLAGLYDRYYEYADLLATQGLVDIAAKYVKMTPADYKGTGGAGSELDKARDRLFVAAGVQKGSVAPNAAFGQQASQRQASTSYAPAQVAAPYAAGPYGSSVPASTGYAPAQNSGYAPAPVQQNSYKPPQTSSAYQPPPTSTSYNPPTQSYGYGQNTNTYQPTSSYQPSSAYAPNGYAPNDPQAQGYGVIPPQQNYGAPQGIIPPPPRAGQMNGAGSNTPPPIPAAQRRDIPGWNDAPTLASKRPQSAVGSKEAPKPSAIMSPFPNMTNPMDAQPSGPGSPAGMPPPRSQPGMLPPPPKGISRAPSVQPQAPPPRSAMSPPAPAPGPPQYQQQQPQQSMPPRGPPMNAGPPPPQARAGPPPIGRAGPPPGVMAGPPPPQRALSPLNPGAQGQSRMAGPPPPGQARPASSQMGGPPPPGARAGPPPPGRSPSVTHQPERSASPQAAPAARAPSSKPRHPAGDRSHIPAGSRAVYESLSNELNRVKQANLPPQTKKVVDDTERRLNILFDGLNNETVPQPAINLVNEITKAMAARNAEAALGLHVQLLTDASGEVTSWAPGVKQLIKLGTYV
ncbi:hypothetical protein IAU60_001860 [Kwoniella sp. DSM 27419]